MQEIIRPSPSYFPTVTRQYDGTDPVTMEWGYRIFTVSKLVLGVKDTRCKRLGLPGRMRAGKR